VKTAGSMAVRRFPMHARRLSAPHKGAHVLKLSHIRLFLF